MVKDMKRQMRVARRQFVRGLSSLLTIAETPPRRRNMPAIDEALHRDMEKIGADMWRVVDRELAHEKAARKTLTAAE